MQCPNCGKPIPNNARNCAHCGVNLAKRMPPPPRAYYNAPNSYRQSGQQYYNRGGQHQYRPNRSPNYGNSYPPGVNGFGIGGLVLAISACLISFIGLTRMFGFPIFGLLCALAAVWLVIMGTLKQYAGRTNVQRPLSNAFNWAFRANISAVYKSALIVSLSGVLLNIIFLIVSIVKYVSHPSIWDYSGIWDYL